MSSPNLSLVYEATSLLHSTTPAARIQFINRQKLSIAEKQELKETMEKLIGFLDRIEEGYNSAGGQIERDPYEGFWGVSPDVMDGIGERRSRGGDKTVEADAGGGDVKEMEDDKESGNDEEKAHEILVRSLAIRLGLLEDLVREDVATLHGKFSVLSHELKLAKMELKDVWLTNKIAEMEEDFNEAKDEKHQMVARITELERMVGQLQRDRKADSDAINSLEDEMGRMRYNISF